MSSDPDSARTVKKVFAVLQTSACSLVAKKELNRQLLCGRGWVESRLLCLMRGSPFAATVRQVPFNSFEMVATHSLSFP